VHAPPGGTHRVVDNADDQGAARAPRNVLALRQLLLADLEAVAARARVRVQLRGFVPVKVLDFHLVVEDGHGGRQSTRGARPPRRGRAVRALAQAAPQCARGQQGSRGLIDVARAAVVLVANGYGVRRCLSLSS